MPFRKLVVLFIVYVRNVHMYICAWNKFCNTKIGLTDTTRTFHDACEFKINETHIYQLTNDKNHTRQ